MKFAVRFVILAAAIALLATPSRAQDYPTQRVTLIVPFGAGSVTDGLARLLADKLSDMWKQVVIVENRPGIGGTSAAAKSAPDGHTLLVTSNGHTIAAVVNKNVPFNPAKDFVGVTKLASIPHVLVVPPALPAKTVGEFIALAKSKPGKLNFGSSGVASTSYLGTELFKQAAKIDIQHVPYRSTPEGVTSLLRDDTQLFLLSLNLATELHKSGRLRALAIATADRNPALPDVPTVRESGLDFIYDAWFGLLAPAGTPAPIVEKVSRDVASVLQMPDVVKNLSNEGVEISYSSPAAFDNTLKTEFERNTSILRAGGVGEN